MDHEIQRRWLIEKIKDFVGHIGENISDQHTVDSERVLFRIDGRPFEIVVWSNKDAEMICITTRTADLNIEDFDAAVKFLKSSLETCWEYCVAVASIDSRYDLSMAIFVAGLSQETFEGTVYNLLSCAEAIEENFSKRIDEKEGDPTSAIPPTTP